MNILAAIIPNWRIANYGFIYHYQRCQNIYPLQSFLYGKNQLILLQKFIFFVRREL